MANRTAIQLRGPIGSIWIGTQTILKYSIDSHLKDDLSSAEAKDISKDFGSHELN